MEWIGIVAFALLLSISWDVSKIKHYTKDLYERQPGKVLECPYGYGLCYAFPFGHKPCECETCATHDPADNQTRRGDDEAPPVR